MCSFFLLLTLPYNRLDIVPDLRIASIVSGSGEQLGRLIHFEVSWASYCQRYCRDSAGIGEFSESYGIVLSMTEVELNQVDIKSMTMLEKSGYQPLLVQLQNETTTTGQQPNFARPLRRVTERAGLESQTQSVWG